MFSIKSIKIKNFKSISEKTFELSDLHEIFGKNGAGKTSIQEAAEFCCQGGKGDIEKIRQGADKAEVTLLCEKHGSGDSLSIETSLDRKGLVSCKVRFNNLLQSNPRTFLRQMISFGAFDPRALLDKKTREERILKLLPLKIDRPDVVMGDGAEFPLQNWEAIPWDDHAWQALKAIGEDLKQKRLSLYQAKDKLLKSHKEQDEKLQASRARFFEAHGRKPEEVEEAEDLAEAAGAAAANAEKERKEWEEANEKSAGALNREGAARAKHTEYLDRIRQIEAEQRLLEDRLGHVNQHAKDCLKEAEKARAEHQQFQEKALENNKKYEKAQAQHLEFKGKQGQAREARLLKESSDRLDGLKKEGAEALARHAELDRIVKMEFPALRRKTLEPIKQKLPELEFAEEGGFLYKGVPLDTLSGSETVLLGMRLYSLDKKGRFIFLNEAECLDGESMQEVAGLAKAKGLQVVALRVADQPVGGDWKSTKVEKEAK